MQWICQGSLTDDVVKKIAFTAGEMFVCICAADVFSFIPAPSAVVQVQPTPSTNAQRETYADDPCCG
jgi:hypothetical protein